MKKIIKFDNLRYNKDEKTYYSALIGKTSIDFRVTDNCLDYMIYRFEYVKEPYCNYKTCKKSGTKKCKDMFCKKTYKFFDVDESHSEYVPFDCVVEDLKIDNYSNTPVEKIRLAKQYLLRIINRDPHFLGPVSEFILPKRDIKRFEKSLWNVDGVLV